MLCLKFMYLYMEGFIKSMNLLEYISDSFPPAGSHSGSASATVHAVMHVPWAALQAIIAAGTATPPVETPATPPPAATQATQTELQPL